jgi:hypothetical protein
MFAAVEMMVAAVVGLIATLVLLVLVLPVAWVLVLMTVLVLVPAMKSLLGAFSLALVVLPLMAGGAAQSKQVN